MNESANDKRPNFVTEVVDPPVPQTPQEAINQELKEHNINSFLGRDNPAPTTTPPSPAPVIENVVNTEVQNTVPQVEQPKPKTNKKIKIHPKHLMFLIPAGIIVGVIAIVAYVTRNDYVVYEEDVVTETPMPLPSPTPQPTLAPEIEYLVFSKDNYTFSYPESLFLADCEEDIYFYLEELDSDLACSGDTAIIELRQTNQIPDYYENEGLVATESATLSGEDFLSYEIKASGSNTIFLPFEIDDVSYQFKLNDTLYRTEFLDVVSSFKFLIDITADWETFDNTQYGYSIKYPSDWFLINTYSKEAELSPKSEIRRVEDDSKFQNLVIEVQKDLEDAPLTATQAVSSTRSLVGWDAQPSTELRSLGGVNAQIVRGSFNGVWNTYAIVWFRDSIMQMTWEDTIDRTYDQVIEQMLNSLVIN